MTHLPPRRLAASAAAIAVAGIVLTTAGCSGATPDSSDGSVLRVGVASTVVDWDPHTSTTLGDQQILENIYRGLTVLDPETFEPVGELAESWETSEDGLTWTFELADGAQFSDGSPVTSADVKYSIDRILDPETVATAASDFDAVEEVIAVDEDTVQFVLSEPYSLLALALQLPAWAAIIPDGSGDTIAETKIGAGPFSLEEEVPQQSITLQRSEGWVGEFPGNLDTVEFQVIDDETARISALTSGQIDLDPSVALTQIDVLADDASVNLIEYDSSYVAELGFNTASGPFADPRVRRAVLLALDKEAIAEVATFGNGGVADTMVSPSSPIQVTVDPPVRDLDEAKALLAEAGLADGFGFTFSACGGNGFPDMARAGEVIVDNLAEIGISAQFANQDAGVWSEEVITQGAFDAFICALVSGNDPDGHTYRYFTSDGAYNFSRYAGSPELDALLLSGRQVLDPDERSEIYSEAWQLINADVPWIPLYWLPGAVATASGVEGFMPFPEGNLRLEFVSLA